MNSSTTMKIRFFDKAGNIDDHPPDDVLDIFGAHPKILNPPVWDQQMNSSGTFHQPSRVGRRE